LNAIPLFLEAAVHTSITEAVNYITTRRGGGAGEDEKLKPKNVCRKHNS